MQLLSCLGRTPSLAPQPPEVGLCPVCLVPLHKGCSQLPALQWSQARQ